MMLEAERRHVAEVRMLLASERQRYDTLLDKYHALKVGTTGVPADNHRHGLHPEPIPSSPSDLAIEQVVERFGGNIKLRRKLLQYREDRRQRDDTDDVIADSILNWRDPTDEAIA